MLKPWKTLSQKVLLDLKRFRILQEKVRLPDGRVFDDYYIIDRSEVVIIIPITTNGKIVLVRQYKHGAGKVITEFPAGGADGEKDLVEAAKRELEEETGYVAGKLEYIGRVLDNPTSQRNYKHIYIARDAERTSKQQFDEKEQIETSEHTAKELQKMLNDGRIEDAGCHAAGLLAFSLGKLKYDK
jgi:ADP-ribose pyrophosphatase